MANNRSAITTVPLAAKLNMNSNEEIINNTYDQLNKQNGSLYGGTLSPYFYREVSDTNLKIYDKHGNAYMITQAQHGANGALKRMTPYQANYNQPEELDQSSDWFDTIKLECPEAYDQAIVLSDYNHSDYYWYFTLLTGNGTGTNIVLTLWTVTYDIRYQEVRWDRRSDYLVKCPTSNSPLLSWRFYKVKDAGFVSVLATWSNNYDTSGMTSSGTTISADSYWNIQYSMDNGSLWFGIANYSFSNTALVKQTSYIAGESLFLLKDRNSMESADNFTAANEQGANSNEKIFIAVSQPWNPTNAGGSTYIGVTLYNHKQTGINGMKDLRFVNLMLTVAGNVGLGILHSVCRVVPGPRYIRFVKDKIYTNNGKDFVGRDGTGSSITMNVAWGAFADGSDCCYMVTQWSETRVVHGSTGDDYAPVAVRLKGSFESYTESGTTYFYINNDDFNIALHADNTDLSPGDLYYGVLPTLVNNQYHHRFIETGTNKYKQKQLGYYISYMTDNMLGTQVRFYPGVQSNKTLPDSDTTAWDDPDKDTSYWSTRYENDVAIYNSAGSMYQSVYGWRVLHNYRQGYVSGISWCNRTNEIGTLMTKWDSIDDDFFIDMRYNTCLYRDNDGSMRLLLRNEWEYNAPPETIWYDKLLHIVSERYLLWNTGNYFNCYDIETEKWEHWASDWNNRIIGGFVMGQPKGRCESSNTWNTYVDNSNVRYNYWWRINTARRKLPSIYQATYAQASGVDVSYQVSKTFAPSRLIPYISLNKYATGSEVTIGATGFKDSVVDYFGSPGTSAPNYKTSFTASSACYWSVAMKTDGALVGTSYPTTSSGTAYYNMPLIGVDFVQSYSGKFGVKIGEQGYSILYDGIRPVALYNSTSMVDNVYEFFIVQSQYYAVVNNYICAISYSSSNVLNGIEQIVNVNGMQFIAAFPSCAYFYSPASRSIYAFTGDADLQLFVQTDRISEIYKAIFAPNNEWIYMWTDDGIYVMTQQNIFRTNSIGTLNIYRPFNIYTTDQAYNILEDTDGRTVMVRMDPESTYYNNGLVYETEYFGPGELRTEVIDCWYIRFRKASGYSNNGTIKLYVKTLNGNVVEQSDSITFKITADMWDKNNNYLYRYQPNVQNSEGQSLHIESVYPISYIGFSHSPDSTAQTPPVENVTTTRTPLNI